MGRAVRCISPAVVAVLLVAVAAPSPAQAPSPLGQWRGTSTCLPVEGNNSCNHEITWYDFFPSKTVKGGLTVDAWKFVGSAWEEMGGIDLRYVPAHAAWEGDFQNARVHIVWKFQVTDTGLVGSIEDVPSGLRHRRVHARRAPKPPMAPAAEVEVALREYAGFILTMSSDSIAGRFTPDGVSLDGNSAPIVGPEAIRTHLASFTGFKVLGNTLVADSTRVAMDTAWQWGSYWQRVKVPAGDTVEVSGRFATTWLFSSAKGWLVRRMVTWRGEGP